MTASAPAPQPMDAVVLAGGQGRRFGGDKVQARVDGTRLVERVVGALAPLHGQVIVAVGQRPLALPGTVEVHDEPAGVGPLGGLAPALQAATTQWVAVVAADLLAPSPALLQALRAHAVRHGAFGAMPIVSGRVQPLHAVVRRDRAARATAAALRAGAHGVVALFEGAGVLPVDEATWKAWSPEARPAADVDRVEDLRQPGR